MMNNNNNNNPNNNNHSSTRPFDNTAPSTRFAPTQSSPSLSSSSDTISIGSLNVRGLNNRTKFDALLDDIMLADLSILAMQETHLPEITATCSFKDYLAQHSLTSTKHSYWSYDPADNYGGVGFIVFSFVSKYIQKVHRCKSLFIALNLFLPARKLKLINIYGYQRADFNSKGRALQQHIIQHIKDAEVSGFTVIISGDFNLDPSTYMDALIAGRNYPQHFGLI